MNQHKETRSNSTPTHLEGLPARTRKRAEITSPNSDCTENEDNKRYKNHNSHNPTMSDKAKEILQAIQQINTKLASMDSKLEVIKEDVLQLKVDVQQVKQDVRYANNKIVHVESIQQQQQKQIYSLNKAVNLLEQDNLKCHLSIHNIPLQFNVQQLQDALTNWSCNAFDSSRLTKISLPATRDKQSKIAFIQFLSLADKTHFMSFVKSKQKDSTGKYIPILNDDVFVLEEDDIKRGIELNFRSPMTNVNREIFNWLRKEGKRIHPEINVWMNRGTVNVRLTRGGEAHSIYTLEQAKDFADKQ